MQRYYSQTTQTTYLDGVHATMPDDAVKISEALFREVIVSPAAGKVRAHHEEGLPYLVDPPAHIPTADELCLSIDIAADSARRAVAGDPLRAVEYERAAAEAQAFKAAGYPAGEVPRTVSAWAIKGRTPRQAADSILAEAAAYTEALYCIRETRLQAKELIRAALAGGNIEHAHDIADETIAAIEAAVTGIGNNAS